MEGQQFCHRCQQNRPFSAYNKGTSSNGLHDYCRECQREYEREIWNNNPERRRKWTEKHAERRERNRKHIADHLKSHPCVDCGETNIVVLQFDHVKGEKKFNVSDAIRIAYSIKRLQAEIDKCEIRCVNCHLRKTAKENGYWILRFIE